MWSSSTLSVVVLATLAAVCLGRPNLMQEQARSWVDNYNFEAEIVMSDSVEKDWNYNTNLTDYNLQLSLTAAELAAEFDNAKAEEAKQFLWQQFDDPLLRRQFSKIVDVGYSVLPPVPYRRLNELSSTMQRMYSTATVCNRPGDTSGACYPLDPDLSSIISTSTDWDELLWAWKGWRDAASKQMPDMYAEFVTLLNEAASLNGYADNGAYWRSWYESDTFRQEIERLWNEVRPLYAQLHAYVRRKLQERYPTGTFPANGHIPAHLLGNMWAQSWEGIESLVRPFPDKPGVDVTEEMQRQGYDAERIFRLSEEFFTSLGLIAMPPVFWEKTMMTKPTDRDVVCHASAWDFYNRVDFRVKQCTSVTTKWLITTHHEMGHIEYYLQYKDQPVKFRSGANPAMYGGRYGLAVDHSSRNGTRRILPPVQRPTGEIQKWFQSSVKQCTEVDMGWLLTTHHEMGHVEYFLQYRHQPGPFRDGANPGFHEAIGDTLSLSVTTPEHLQAIGLLPDFEDDPDGDLNFLMQQALSKIAFLPFGYLIDQWRWDVFNGNVSRADYNKRWWDARCKYQGLSPPVERSAYDDFDAGAKYHVPANTPYIRYFVSHILQFQFHKALCDASGNTNPLHRCDIYQSLEAGTLMRLYHWGPVRLFNPADIEM